MARWPYILCVIFVAAALGLGVRELLRDADARPEPSAAPESVGATAAAAGESISALPSGIEVPAAQTPPNAKPDSPNAQEAAQREALHSETITLFDLGLHEEGFAHSERWEIGLGLTEQGTAFPNDRISAVAIPGGLQATLFADAHAEGFKLTLGPGTHDLSPYAFSNRTSSIEVSRYGQSVDVGGPEGCVVLYEHRGADLQRRGLAWRLDLPRGHDEWTFRASRVEFLDNQASTAWVAQGFELVLFDDPDASGVALVLGPGLHELELLGFNDRASSARVRRVR